MLPPSEEAATNRNFQYRLLPDSRTARSVSHELRTKSSSTAVNGGQRFGQNGIFNGRLFSLPTRYKRAAPLIATAVSFPALKW